MDMKNITTLACMGRVAVVLILELTTNPFSVFIDNVIIIAQAETDISE